ncbi:peptidase M23 [Frateuria sp. Soil773]|nr:peptidase M23 [Frateuria sp. Soil773]
MLDAMNGSLRWFAASGAMLVLAGCAITRSSVVVEPAPGVRPVGTNTAAPAPAHTRVPGGSYKVAHGDTLYSIAFRNGVDFRDLAGWNGIAVPYTIWPGQVLRLSPPAKVASAHAAPVPSPAHPSASAPPAPAAPVFEPVAPSSATASVPAPAAPLSAKPPAAGAPAPAVPAPGSTTTVVPVAGLPTPKPAVPAPAPAPVPAAPAGATRSAGGVVWRWPVQGKLIKGFRSGDAIPGIELAGKSGDPVLAAGDGVVVYSGNGLVGYGELIIIKHNDSFLSAYGHNRKRLVKEGQRVSAGQQIAELGSTGASRDELQFQIRRDGNPVDPLGYLPPR